MLVCNVSLRPPRAGIAADIVETVEAVDATATGQVVFATLVDDPASVNDRVDAYLGEIMLEAASADAAVNAGLAYAAAIAEAVAAGSVQDAVIPTVLTATVDEAVTATSAPDATVSGWTPASLTGLIGWWSMNAPADYTVSGSQVVSMVDLSGAGNTLGDGSTTQKPTYSATGLNSLPTMLCDGALTHIDIAAFPIGTGNTLTVFGVAILTSACGNYGRLIGYGAPTRNDNNFIGSFNFSRNATNATMWLERNSVTSTPKAASYATPHRFIATINSSGVMTVYIDGAASSTATSSGNWTSGGTLRVGSNVGGSTARWASAISEIGIATGFTNSTDVAVLDTYLRNKWGL